MKKLLALVLALVMSMSLVTISNAAFSDAKEIKHAEAVGVMNALGVINGMPDGSFAPDGNVTRAEMAKMISIIMLGDVDASAFVGTSTGLTDIKGHWAEGYIQYCYSQGIIAGKGDGTFAPNANVTTVEAAKMLLGAIGYNSNVQGYVGSDWAINVTRDAQISGFFKDLKGLVSGKALSRDEAAQMIWNALQAPTVVKTATINSEGKVSYTYSNKNESNQWNASLLNKTFDAVTYEGILTGSGKWGASTNKDHYSIQAKKLNGNDLTTSSSPALNAPLQFKWKGMDLTAMAGEYVKVVYNTEDKTTYGVFSVADMNTVVYSTTDKVEDIKSDSIKIDGVKYDTDSLGYSYTSAKADAVKFVDSDGDGKLDYWKVDYVGVYKVTYVGSDSFTLSAADTNNANSYTLDSQSNKFADVKAYDGMAKDDIVVVKQDLYKDEMVVEKADVVSGTVSGIKTGKVLVNGTWYQSMAGVTSLALGNVIDFYAIGNTIYYAKVTSGAKNVENVAMVITVGNTSDTLNAAQAKLLFSDGSKKVVTVAADSGYVAAGSLTVGSLYTYETKNNGDYRLKALASFGDYTALATHDLKDKDGGTTAAAAIGYINDGTNNISIADNAVIFVLKGTANSANAANDGKVITGKELKSARYDSVTAVANAATATSNGLTKVAFAAVSATAWPTTTSSANYGYIVADPYMTEVDGTKYVTYQLWDGSNTVTYKFKADTIPTGSAKGLVIGYDTADGDIIKNVTDITTTAAAVKGLDGTEITFDVTVGGNAAGTSFKLDGNTTYLYVNSDAEKAEEIGVSGGSVARANNPASGIYVKNVRVLANSDKTIKLIVVDVDNKLALQASEMKDVTVTNTATLTAANVKVTVDGNEVDVAAGATDAVKAGDLIKITNLDATKTLTYSVTGVDGTHSGATLVAGASVTLVATGSADVAITWTSLA